MGVKLSEPAVKAAKAPEKGTKYLFDDHRDAPRGFGLKLSSVARSDQPKRVFIIRYKLAGADRQMTIGEWPTWSVEAARARAKELRREIDDGADPLARRRAAPRLLVVRTPGSGEVDVGDVQADDRKRSDFVRRSGLLPYGSPGERGSLGLMCAGGPVAAVFSTFGEQIG